ncbi:MAG: hypothetical protein JO189_19770 [Deltaproteobacteria bacterium]|nr:hypothetical protein [Deltaproteobacteria bacterium]
MLPAYLLWNFFAAVIGTERDARNANKTDAVCFILQEFNLAPEATAINRRSHARYCRRRHNGLFTTGVTYGYGTRREMIDAEADAISITLLAGQIAPDRIVDETLDHETAVPIKQRDFIHGYARRRRFRISAEGKRSP